MTKIESGNERLNHSKNGLKETETELSGLKTNTKVNRLKGEIKENLNAGKVEYIRDSNDYKIYSYIVKEWAFPGGVKKQAVKQLKLKDDEGIIITNINGKPKHGYGKFHKFKKGEKVYIKIPKKEEHHESENETIDEMKCKGGEYFGIDISKFNEDIELEKFKKWNREKWDSEKTDTRGVSFVYIRASDGKTEDKKVKKHVNKIKEYNIDKAIKDNHEQIAVGFYHRMDYHSAEENANTFINIYNANKDKHGGNNLIPMLDIELDWNKSEHKKGKKRPELSKEEAQKKVKRCLEIIEEKTGIVPGIYTTVGIYNNYFLNDNRFNRYKRRIAAYPPSYDRGPMKGREIINGPTRIDHETGSVNLGSKTIKPEMYQSSQEGTVGGAYSIIDEKNGKKYKDTDMDHTKDIKKLFAENNKSK